MSDDRVSVDEQQDVNMPYDGAPSPYMVAAITILAIVSAVIAYLVYSGLFSLLLKAFSND